MGVDTTWTSPAAGGALDLATGGTITETVWDAVISDLLVLGGAAGYVTQTGTAAGTASNPTTSSTSFVDMNEMSVTLTTTGGNLEANLDTVCLNSTVGIVVYIALSLDGAAEVAVRGPRAPVAGYDFYAATHFVFTGVAAGSHTVKGRWKVAANTGTLCSTNRYLEVKEQER